MLIIDVYALETIDLLDFIHQIALELLLAKDPQDVMRITRTVHQSVTCPDELTLLNVDVNSTRQQVLGLSFSIGTLNEDFSLAAADPTKMTDSVNLCDNRGFLRLTRFKELDDTGETTRNVFGLRGFSRNLGKMVTGVHLITSLSHQMSL